MLFKRLALALTLFPLFSFANVFELNSFSENERGYLFEIHGSNTIGAKLAPALIESWFKTNGAIEVNTTNTNIENEKVVTATFEAGVTAEVFVAAHGSGTGFKQMQTGRGDIAAASRPIKETENALFPSTNLTDFSNELVLAIDGIAVIVNPKNPIENLTIEQVGRIFSGELSNWNEIGGPNTPITVHARDANSGTFDTFNSLVLKRGFSLAKAAVRYESNDKLSDIIASNVGAIGFTSLASINRSKSVAIIDGESSPMLPMTSIIATEDYPLARRLYLYQLNTNNPYVTDFFEFAKTSEGQNQVANIGFVSQNLNEIEMTLEGELPAGYSFITRHSNRITTNFRFKPGTKTLDNKALDDLQRLADLMKQPGNENRKILLMGFSNKQKDEFKARLLSETRVIAVKRELQKYGVVSSALTGYGQINPVASNKDIKYALRNQRVEVWIR
jgi:phosphate transport system substrate-binding protein